ncbi:Plectin [Fasciolopsis buskii]|uniref:Plectin n=1 Tax=Fasciolopsis buskii TaxID=27845 RepID=A0A8E0RN90_9TREM|nr:Plectin [Fasciolopsis buski]
MYQIRIVNIRADEIVDGNPKLTLGLIWIIILHFHSMNASRCVISHANQIGFRDPRGVNEAPVHLSRPGLIDFRRVDAQTAKQNTEWAFSLAERELHVVRLFDSEDVSVFSDEKSMMTYIASLYEALAADNPAVPPMPSLYGETVLNTTTQLFGMPNEATKQLQSRWSEYRTLAADLAQWLRSTKDRMASRHFPPDLESMEHRVLDDLKRHRREERPRRERDRQQLVRMFEELKPALHSGQLPNDPFLSIDQIHRLWREYDIVLQEREIAARTETHRLDRLQWAGERVVRECKAVDAQLTGLERHLQDTSSGLDASRLFGAQLDRWTEQLGLVETRVNGLFNQVQHLRSGRYTQTDQIYRDVCTLHQRMLDLQRRFRDRVQTNGFHNVISPISAPLVGHSVSPGGLSRSSTSQIDQRYAFLTPIQRCMRWINEHLVAVEQGSHGTRPAFSLFQLHAQFVLHFWLGYLNSSEAERTLDTWVL